PVESIARAVTAERGARLTIVNTPDEAVVAGEPAAVDRVLARLAGAIQVPLTYDMVAHCPEVGAVREAWRALHRRPTQPVPGVRFYTAAHDHTYEPDAESAADALTGQAMTTLDFRRVILRAWSDGVRVFVEHGPRNLWARGITSPSRSTAPDAPRSARRCAPRPVYWRRACPWRTIASSNASERRTG